MAPDAVTAEEFVAPAKLEVEAQKSRVKLVYRGNFRTGDFPHSHYEDRIFLDPIFISERMDLSIEQL
ncbi:MAG: hypothetical protein ACP5KV_05885 [Candidatus Methanomethylicaceae archaeon]